MAEGGGGGGGAGFNGKVCSFVASVGLPKNATTTFIPAQRGGKHSTIYAKNKIISRKKKKNRGKLTLFCFGLANVGKSRTLLLRRQVKKSQRWRRRKEGNVSNRLNFVPPLSSFLNRRGNSTARQKIPPPGGLQPHSGQT